MLQSQRVTLREIQRDDLERQHVFENDVELHLMRHSHPPRPVSLNWMHREFDERLSQAPDPNNIWFAIEADDQYIGQAGLMDIDRMHGTANIGIFIGEPQHRGIGLGRETIALMLDYAFRYHNLRKVSLSVIGNNERAIKTYLKCGFVVEGRQREQEWSAGTYEDLITMGLFREEWLAENGKE